MKYYDFILPIPNIMEIQIDKYSICALFYIHIKLLNLQMSCRGA